MSPRPFLPRCSGVLLHPTSLPGPFGSGDLGPAAYHFVDWLVAAGQSVWQMLPLGGIGPGNSPYMSSSAFAGNPLLVDLQELQGKGWLTQADLQATAEMETRRLNFAAVHPFRMGRLWLASQRFRQQGSAADQADFLAFCQKEAEWLDDYALFMTIAGAQDWRNWSDWPQALALREPAALAKVAQDAYEEIAFWKFGQWCFFRQWHALKRYANGRGVKIFGDIPIFIAYQSADVWARPDLFELDQTGAPTVIAGVPPDYFSATGQRWGNPLYRWSVHEAEGFAWWIARLRRTMALLDLVRIDHFRGFAAYWEIPATEETAVNGRWLPGPGAKLFSALKNALGELPIVAEDLGVITPDVEALRDDFALPGMRVLHFAFGGEADQPFLPHNYIPNTVVYTGTHDNNTTVGWWQEISAHEQAFVRAYLGSDGQQIHWDLIRAASASVANLAVIPMQDVLGLPAEARMNLPGKRSGYWEWRFSWDQLQPSHAQTLARLSAVYGRAPFQAAALD